MRRGCAAPLTAAALVVAGLAVPAPASANVVANTAPTSYAGEGFDVYTAQPTSTMRAWLGSTMRAVNIYVGGVNRYDTKQPNLNAAWVSTVTDNGWRLIPTYVGLQAPCTTSSKKFLITPSKATAQGRGNATDAVNQLQALGIGTGSPVYFDMEMFDYNNAACDKAVSAFFDGWTYQLHRSGYRSGIYGHWNSTLRLLVSQYTSTAHKRPDDIWWARYNTTYDGTTRDPVLPAGYWQHHRIHQWRNVTQSYNGISVNVDSDTVDADTAGAATPTPPGGPPYLYKASGTQGSTTGGLNVRSTPSTSGTLLRTIPEGGDVPIVCQTTGDAVNGDPVWDQLDPNAGGGYVSDLYTSTPGQLSWAGTVPRCDGVPAGHLSTPLNGNTLEAGRTTTLSGWFTATAGVAGVVFQASTDGGATWSTVGTDGHGGNGRYAVTWPPAWTNGASVTVQATVTDTVGNIGTSNWLTGIRTVDTTAPRVTVAGQPVATLAPAVRLTWSSSEAGSGVKSYDVRYQRAAYFGGFGRWSSPSGWSGTTATTKSLKVAPGYDYCFEVRARDRAGNLGGWSARRCIARALDDRALSAGPGWSRRSGSGFYLGTYTTTTGNSRTLARSGARVVRVGVVGSTCAKCGAVAVYVGGTRVGTANFYAATAARQQIVLLPKFRYRSGTVTLRTVSTGKTVQMDGLVLSRT
jgi:hypothetical protein